ncbi:MAG: arginase family protein, partial [Cyanobacteria bacterium J06555_13]
MSTKQEIIATFDPGGVGIDNGNIFGFPFDYDTADIIIFSVPWEVTVSFHGGTAKGPQAVLEASPQLDFYDYDNPEGWQQGIYMSPVPEWIGQKNEELRSPAQAIVTATEQGQPLTTDLKRTLNQVNDGCHQLNQWLLNETRQALGAGKKVGILGGDHSVPLGAMQALAEKYPTFGILHIDAHCDLR